MKTVRDLEVARALGLVEVPPLKPRFHERLWARVDATAIAVPAPPVEPAVAPLRRPWLRWPAGRRAAVVFAAVGAAAAAVVVVAALLGWLGTGGVGPVQGPPPAVARVLANVEGSLDASRAMEAVFYYEVADVRAPADAAKDWTQSELLAGAVVGGLERRLEARVLATADGRMRSTTVEMPDGSSKLPQAGAALGETPGLLVLVRNLPDGLSYKAWDAEGGLQVQQTADPPAGPPDARTSGWFPGEYGGLFSPLAFAGGTVRNATYEGRAVLVVTAPAQPDPFTVDGAGRISPTVFDQVAMTVDAKTWLPVRVERSLRGHVVEAWGYRDLRLDPAATRADFAPEFPETATFHKSDAGFRRVTLERAAKALHGRLVLPAVVPVGFELALVTVKTDDQASATDAPSPGREATLEGPWRAPESDIVSLVYRRGFRSIVVTCRTADGVTDAAAVDPFLPEPPARGAGQPARATVVRLKDGAWRGATARVRTGVAQLPHLWAAQDGLLVTVAGDLKRGDLIRLADSLETYGVLRTRAAVETYLKASPDDLDTLRRVLSDDVVLRDHWGLFVGRDKEDVLLMNADILDFELAGDPMTFYVGDGWAVREAWTRGDSVPSQAGVDGGSARALVVRTRGDHVVAIDYFGAVFWRPGELGDRWHPTALRAPAGVEDTAAAAAAVARRHAAALKAKDAAALARLAAADVRFLDVEHGDRGGRSALRERYERMFRRPRDLSFERVHAFSGPGWAAVMWTASSREGPGEATGLTVLEIRDGRVARETLYYAKSKMPFE